ncbi:MAG: transcription termination factor NusA [Patescibacteria group bacterium]|jgi:N utilization substance protein A
MSEIQDAIQLICEEKNISVGSVLETIEAALAAAYRKDFGQKNQNIKVTFDLDTNKMEVFDVKTVVEDMDLEELEKERMEFIEKKEAGEEVDEESLRKFNPKTEIMLSEAKELKAKAKIGEEISTKLEVPSEFGRMAAQTAKQVIIQRLREAERDVIFEEFKEREGALVSGIVQRREGRLVMVDIGRAVAVMPPDEQIYSENYTMGQRLKFLIVAVEKTPKGPEIRISRTHPDIVRELFKTEVPEIESGAVEIKAIAREAGGRSKVAVVSHEDNIDPVGSCVGQRGTRVQTVISELGGEKIDIIEWSKNIEKFISHALSPAKVEGIKVDEERKTALVKVKEDQLSLAIGRDGQNVRLAAKLTEYRIDIEGAEEILPPTEEGAENNNPEESVVEETIEEIKKDEASQEN